ncbi:MAG: CotH kinase family protein, partial [Paraprevotella sp.]|nr:CotH kinase family protein [Paraprevotella sp.]
LVVNGESQGVYYLCERAKDMVSKESILLEFDTYAYDEDKIVFKTKRNGLPVSVRQPEDLPKPLRKKMEMLVNSLDSLPSEHVDVLSFVDYFIVQELCQNGEPNGPRSCFVHSTSDEQFAAGPVWDFDLAFNTVGIDTMKEIRPAESSQYGVHELAPDSFYISEALWYKEYLKSPKFVQLLKERWWVLRPQFESLTTFVDSLDGLIRKAAVDDQTKWNNMDGVRYDTCTTYPSAFENLRHVYEERIVKLDSLITSLSVYL